MGGLVYLRNPVVVPTNFSSPQSPPIFQKPQILHCPVPLLTSGTQQAPRRLRNPEDTVVPRGVNRVATLEVQCKVMQDAVHQQQL